MKRRDLMRKLMALPAALLLALVLIVPMFAMADGAAGEEGKRRLVDGAGLLTESEAASLTVTLDEISERHQMDVVVVTAPSLKGNDPQEFADLFYEQYGYGYGSEKDGILLLLSMEERDYAFSTTGKAIEYISDYGLEYLEGEMLSYLGEGNYFMGFRKYAEGVDYLLGQGEQGQIYDEYYEEPEPRQSTPLSNVFGALGNLLVGAGAAGGVVNSEKRRLKSVTRQRGARHYMANVGGLRASQDISLGIRETRQPIQVAAPSSSRPGGEHRRGSTIHTSSSGHVHGGKTGKF